MTSRCGKSRGKALEGLHLKTHKRVRSKNNKKRCTDKYDSDNERRKKRLKKRETYYIPLLKGHSWAGQGTSRLIGDPTLPPASDAPPSAPLPPRLMSYRWPAGRPGGRRARRRWRGSWGRTPRPGTAAPRCPPALRGPTYRLGGVTAGSQREREGGQTVMH